MSAIVCKFGGSSLSDAGMLRRVLDIVRSDDRRRFIVLSAPGKRYANDAKITDLLYAAHRADEAELRHIFPRIRERYTQIAAELCPQFDISAELDQIESTLHISADYAASRGEYLCAKLFAAYSGMRFVDAAELISFYPDGTPDFQRSMERIRSRLCLADNAVIPGFYGSMDDGSVKTFSRGGSDVSGALIASALNADLYENWTDVNGLFTADPNLIPTAKRNPLVSLEQMQSLAGAGANVLHPDSLNVLRGTGVDTLIKNTFAPDSEGTRVSESCRSLVPCITGKRGVPRQSLAEILRGRCDCAMETSDGYCVLSVFGLDSTVMRRIHYLLKHICIIHMHDHFKIITQNAMYETAIKLIHEMI